MYITCKSIAFLEVKIIFSRKQFPWEWLAPKKRRRKNRVIQCRLRHAAHDPVILDSDEKGGLIFKRMQGYRSQ